MLPRSGSFCLGAATSVLLLVGLSDGASASPRSNHHPRRTEVNYRLANQNRRTNHEFCEGEIVRAQARRMHGQDYFVRREERLMASQHHGHITRAEQRALNQQETGLSGEIGQ
jgi:hypothetical protein